MIKRILTYLTTSIIIITVFGGIAHAADTLDFKRDYSVFINYHQNYHTADFSALPGVPNCCPHFDKGEGSGFSFGGNFSFPLPYRFSIGFGFGYYKWNADFISDETKPVRIGNDVEQALIRHHLDISLDDVGLTPFLKYNIIGRLHVFAGGHIGTYVVSDFHQYETLLKPEQGSFYDTGTKTRNDTSGKIPQLQAVYASLFFGIQYDIRLGTETPWFISPTLTYNLGRSEIIQNYDWRTNALMAGVEIKYSPLIIKQTQEVFKEDIIIDTLTITSEDIIRNTIKQGKTSTKEYKNKTKDKIVRTRVTYRTDTLFKRPVPHIRVDINVPVINLEGQFVTQAFPLVPVVFFAQNSADLQTFYDVDADIDSFDINKIKINALEYQKNLLNIIGKRMHQLPAAKLYITGYCDSVSEGVKFDLAKHRAAAVVSYLRNKWKIEARRLIIKPAATCNPPEATVTKNDSGFADNRRAELFSDNPKLLAPLKNKRYIEPRAINPPVLKFDPSGSTSNGIARWALVIKKGDKIISKRSGNGFPGLLYDTLKTKDFETLFSDIPLKVEFAIIDFEGQISEMKKEIPVKADTSEFELQRLSLILFKVGDEKLNRKAKNDIKEFLKDISKNSIIRVKGYTDPLGTKRLNRDLSQKRAENTTAFIRKILSGVKIEQARGYASSEFPPGISSYSTPIERFLSRTVFIEVLKKIK